MVNGVSVINDVRPRHGPYFGGEIACFPPDTENIMGRRQGKTGIPG
jgi:hypothetical protein